MIFDSQINDAWDELAAADPWGSAARRRIRARLEPNEYRNLVTGFAVNLKNRFALMEADALAADARQIASLADVLGFEDLRRATMRLIFACNSGEGVLDALARVSIAQTDAIVTIAVEANELDNQETVAA